MIHFVGDTHFWHSNILKYEAKNRVFGTIEEMNAALVRHWNDAILKDDRVYFLGDFGFGNNKCREILKELHGYKIIIKGNHDPSTKKLFEMGWHEVYKEYVLYDDHKPALHLIHDPDKLEKPKCDIVIHGHVHSLFKQMTRDSVKYVNVGVDVWDLKPVSLIELEKYIEENF